MDTSRRAVESYWRSRLIDSVTSDDSSLAPVYKLDEISSLLRSSHPSITSELSHFILKRLHHSSPLVIQKSLRLIKYAVPKSGTAFRREMQRNAAQLKELFHYKGTPDPLKGDALNKAVRETAHAAVSAVFAVEDREIVTSSIKVEGFGSSNYVPEKEERKSFFNEMVDLGSASIKQGLSTFAKVEGGGSHNYKSPALRRSLTSEGGSHSYESEAVKGTASGWNPEAVRSGVAVSEESGGGNVGVKSREERLLETIVTSGGVRLQPTREALQAFLTEAVKLDAVPMSRAIESKLQSHLWQVRMKAICVLESILRKKDEDYFLVIASYFSENRDSVIKCSELPNVSLREKASKVLNLLGGEPTYGIQSESEEPSDAKQMPVPVVQMPNLIDTDDPEYTESEASYDKEAEQRTGKLASSGSFVDDLFGSGPIDGQETSKDNDEHDPFAGVSFHVAKDKEHDDIFSGLTVDDKRSDVVHLASASNNSEVFDIFSGNSEQLIHGNGTDGRSVDSLMAGLTLNGVTQENKQPGVSGGAFTGTSSVYGINQPGQLPTNGALNGLLGATTQYPLASMQYNVPPNIMLNPAFSAQPMNYAAMNAFIAQQQLLFQNFGNVNGGFGHPTAAANEGGHSSAIPDIFQLSSNQVQSQGPLMTSTRKEETKAFDFIADHVSAARDTKRMF